jgi:hypothetical protein
MTQFLATRKYGLAILTIGALFQYPSGWSADSTNPLDAAYRNPQDIAYWKEHVSKMDPQAKGTVSKESFLKHYGDLWDRYVPAAAAKAGPAGKTSVPTGELSAAGQPAFTVDELAERWATLETQNPLDPQYKTPLWRRDHVQSMDSDHDGSVTKDEFLAHMETHWDDAVNHYQATALTHEQTMKLMSLNPLDPNYKPR